MDFKKLASALVICLAMVGCDDPAPPVTDTITFPDRNAVCADPTVTPCTTDAEGATEESRTVPAPEDADPVAMTFIVSTLSIPTADGDLAPGFNLDGLDSGDGDTEPTADCQRRVGDYDGIYDPGLVGVDNALEGLVPVIETFLDETDCGGDTTGCLDRTVQAQIQAGTVILLAELTNVNNTQYDTDVNLQLYLGTVAGGGTLMTDSGTGAVLPDQTFDTDMAVGPLLSGDIFAGRFRADGGTITIPIDAGGFSLTLLVSSAEIRFNVADSGLTEGLIGGSLLNSDIVTAAMEFAPDQVSLVEGFLMTVSDITPSAEDQRACEAMSVGIIFGAVPAVRNP